MENYPKVAVVGTGYWGKNLVRNFAELGALRAVCDSDFRTLVDISSNYREVEGISQVENLLRRRDIDAVVIATPAATHYELAKAAMLAGKDVFVEKPMTLRVSEAEELLEISKTENRILFVGHLLEYHPAVAWLKLLVDGGELGKIRYFYSNRLNFGKFRREGDVLWELAPHDISMMIYLLGVMPEKVATSGYSWINPGIADVTLTRLTFPGNIFGHIFVSWLNDRKVQELVLQGEKAIATFNDTVKDKLVISPFFFNPEDKNHFPIKNDSWLPSLNPEEPLKIECREFLDCVATRRRPRTDGENGLRVVKVLETCQRSMKQKGAKLNVK